MPNTITLLQFRTGNHYFPIETGIWKGLDISKRTCNLWVKPGAIADELHSLLMCPFFHEKKENTHKTLLLY